MVDLQRNSLQHSSDNSASSGIDLSSLGLGSSSPSSPALNPTDNSANRARRRTSWNRIDVAQDPLRFDLHTDSISMDPGPSKLDRSAYAAVPPLSSDDPFFSPTEQSYPLGTYPPGLQYGAPSANPYAGQSSASLISRDSESVKDDYEARLTSNASNTAGWEGDMSGDTERTGGITPRRRTTLRYSASSSPMKRTETVFRNVSKNLRRVSLRVVNFAGNGLEHSIRLPDGDEDGSVDHKEEDRDEELPDLSKVLPIRGRTLGCFGPRSRVRLGLFHFLVHPWTEPMVLVLIVVNAVVLTVQASQSETAPADGSLPPPVKGYFHTWEDYALFVLFVIFT